jgi:hypothetical protein
MFMHILTNFIQNNNLFYNKNEIIIFLIIHFVQYLSSDWEKRYPNFYYEVFRIKTINDN